MNRTYASILVAIAMVTTSAGALAQFVKGNEAVTSTTSGRKVDTPPVPSSAVKVCAAADKCHAGAWHMVETASGLLECTEPYARPTACRTSTYGSQKLPRLWIVKTRSLWRWCQYPNLNSKCVDMFARPPANLPYDAVQ
jgi:hypothetical protein